jgi:hypothetical protein
VFLLWVWMMTGNVMVLRPKDTVRQDSEPVVAIYRDLGTVQAERVVTRALGELALAMGALTAQVRSKDLQDLPRQLRRLQRMSEQLGLISLGAVAADARGCLDHADATAFSAVWARLLRVAERSMVVEPDLHGRSG